jgi:hypothetical protein
MARTGRPKKPGIIYRFDFYYRFTPGEDPPELEALLESIVQAQGRKRRDILQAAIPVIGWSYPLLSSAAKRLRSDNFLSTTQQVENAAKNWGKMTSF